ncbi:MAG: Eco57I restriction-modification methylase domain-containing protein, partial [Halobacteriaceae archaeon]
YYNVSYESAFGNYDLYVLFVSKGLDILGGRGKFGYILPNKLFQVDYGEKLRGKLASERVVSEIVNFGSNQVFSESATTYTSLLILEAGSQNDEITYWKLDDGSDPASLGWLEDTENWTRNTFPLDSITDDTWDFHRQEIQSVIDSAETDSFPLQEITASIGRGSSTGSDEVFEVNIESRRGDNLYVISDVQEEPVPIEKEVLRKPIHSTDFDKYIFEGIEDKRLIWPYSSEYELRSDDEFSSRYPLAWDYLQSHKEELEDRADYSRWYAYSAPRNLSIHDSGEILIPLLADSPAFAPYPTPQSDYVLMASGGFGISLNDEVQYSPLYILALINSKLLFVFLQSISNVFRGGYITCTKQYFRDLPIREINFESGDRPSNAGLENLVDEGLNSGEFTTLLAKVQKQIENESEVLIHDILVHLANEAIDLRNDKQTLNIEILDHLGSYSDGPTLADV